MKTNNKNLSSGVIDFNKLIFRIGDVSKMVGVSSRQLRYWGQKGYIEPIRKNNHSSRAYDFANFLKISFMKDFLDHGYTLNGALRKTNDKKTTLKAFREFMDLSYHGTTTINGKTALNLGYFNSNHEQILYAVIANNSIEYKLLPNEK